MKHRLKQPLYLIAFFFFAQSLTFFVGCSSDTKKTAESVTKPPKPVSTMVLKQSSPSFQQNAIHQINGESFVWKITNREWSRLSGAEDRELVVERLKVKVTSDVISFLGSWNFVAIEFEDPSAVDLDQDLITGRLFFKNDDDRALDDSWLNSWSGDRVLIEQTRWMLRAGDTVRVALIPESSAKGFYVPMKAVRRENGKTFIHVVGDKKSRTDNSQTDESPADATATRVMVNVTSEDSVSNESLMLCIEPISAGQLQEGTRVVVGGTHYLDDGDVVRVVPLQRASEGGR